MNHDITNLFNAARGVNNEIGVGRSEIPHEYTAPRSNDQAIVENVRDLVKYLIYL